VSIKVALPKGQLLEETAAFLEKAGWGLEGYNSKMRNYRLKASKYPGLLIKAFHERDIPVQVAIGNYDLGICGLNWVEELTVKYSSSALIKIRDLGYGEGTLYTATSSYEPSPSMKKLVSDTGVVRIASEYPNISEAFALNIRLKQFNIFPLWGAAEAYPPENANLVLVSANSEEELLERGLFPVSKVLNYTAFLIANKNSWKTKDLSEILGSLDFTIPAPVQRSSSISIKPERSNTPVVLEKTPEDTVHLALPDGHQQKHAVALLNKAGIQFDDYPSQTGNRRPVPSLEGIKIKVIRPQDMPLQVANGNFDIAITGRDWLTEHLNMFPSSPITELLDMKFGRVRIVAVIANELPVNDVYGLQEISTNGEKPFRIASEYTNIADRYARENRLGMYKIIPTWGATEAFLPEDADMLIENTETGSTIARHNLKIIDTLFISTGCLIGNKGSMLNPVKQERIKAIIGLLRPAVEG